MHHFSISPKAMNASVWCNRRLISALIESEVVSRYRDPIMGMLRLLFNSMSHLKQSTSAASERSCQKELFDSLLKSKSAVIYESNSGCIESPTIVTLEGAPANCLVRGRRYVYRCRVRFAERVTNVHFEMMIKTMPGYEVDDAVFVPKGQNILHVGSG